MENFVSKEQITEFETNLATLTGSEKEKYKEELSQFFSKFNPEEFQLETHYYYEDEKYLTNELSEIIVDSLGFSILSNEHLNHILIPLENKLSVNLEKIINEIEDCINKDNKHELIYLLLTRISDEKFQELFQNKEYVKTLLSYSTYTSYILSREKCLEHTDIKDIIGCVRSTADVINILEWAEYKFRDEELMQEILELFIKEKEEYFNYSLIQFVRFFSPNNAIKFKLFSQNPCDLLEKGVEYTLLSLDAFHDEQENMLKDISRLLKIIKTMSQEEIEQFELLLEMRKI